MIGKNPLWVAKQHGRSIATMLRVYAAWAEGAVETDVEAIKRSMNLTPDRQRSSVNAFQRAPMAADQTQTRKVHMRGRLAVDLSVERYPVMQVPDFKRKYLAGERDSKKVLIQRRNLEDQ